MSCTTIVSPGARDQGLQTYALGVVAGLPVDEDQLGRDAPAR